MKLLNEDQEVVRGPGSVWSHLDQSKGDSKVLRIDTGGWSVNCGALFNKEHTKGSLVNF